jgi:hypothetical protein
MLKATASSRMPVILVTKLKPNGLTMFKPNGLVVVTTDFGTSGSYVGAMRGAVLQAYGSARLIDLTHEVPPQDVREASRILAAAAPFYPDGTVHLVVVDPGVGTSRREVVVVAGGQAFVGPDNGVLLRVASVLGLQDARAIEHPHLKLEHVSSTFHGRDIFGPTAGAVAGGFRISDIGPKVSLVELADSLPAVVVSTTGVRGHVEAIDHFGNVLTSIHADQLPAAPFRVAVGGQELTTHVRSYGEVATNTIVTLVSSEGMLEIAQCNGNASTALGVKPGDLVQVDAIG